MGLDVAADPVWVKQRIALMPQKTNLDTRLQARELLIYHARYHVVPRTE